MTYARVCFYDVNGTLICLIELAHHFSIVFTSCAGHNFLITDTTYAVCTLNEIIMTYAKVCFYDVNGTLICLIKLAHHFSIVFTSCAGHNFLITDTTYAVCTLNEIIMTYARVCFYDVNGTLICLIELAHHFSIVFTSCAGHNFLITDTTYAVCTLNEIIMTYAKVCFYDVNGTLICLIELAHHFSIVFTSCAGHNFLITDTTYAVCTLNEIIMTYAKLCPDDGNGNLSC